MSVLIREFGLNQLSMAASLTRSIGVERKEVTGTGWRVVNNDCVDEARRLETDSVDLIVTSIPFSNHYEYTPSYNDFGHTDGDEHFFAQMDFLTPELLRVLKPGRLACVHTKDRILFGSATGFGTPTVNPFHAKCIAHYMRHGFAYMGLIFVDTDVVRENSQTYRLGWTENGKDSTKMGVGSPEFVLLLRKLPTDRTRAYADERVTKTKPLCSDEHGEPVPWNDKAASIPGTGYSRVRWQIDAHARWRSSGDRLLTADELAAIQPDRLGKVFAEQSVRHIYDYQRHVALGEALEGRHALPTDFACITAGSVRDDVWTDVARMRTLNTDQAAKGREKHVCPLQFDIVDRLIDRYSNPGELVMDPFGGLMTVPVRALKMKRRGFGIELNAQYWQDGVRYMQAMENETAMPSLLELLDAAPVRGAAE